MTQPAVVAKLGQPTFVLKGRDGSPILVYRGPMGAGYRIDFSNGVAVATLDLQK